MSKRAGHGVMVAVLAGLVLLVVANNTSAAVVQPAIGSDFNAGPADVGWIVFGYAATFAISTALFGGIARHIGVERSLAIGVGLFSSTSALTALAPDLPTLVIGRMLQGLGAGSTTLAISMIARHFHGPQRGRALGLLVAAVGTGQAIGPLVGGVLLEIAGWRAAVAIGSVGAPGVWFLLRSRRPRPETTARFDGAGALVLSATVMTAVFVVNRVPVLGVQPITAAAAILLGLLASGLALHVSRRRDAFIPLSVVGNRDFLRLSLLAATGMSTFIGTIALVPIAAAGAHDLSGVALGIMLLPMAVTTAMVSPQNARVEARIGRRWTTALALGCLAAGSAGVSLIGAGAPPWVVAGSLIGVGLGFSLLNAPLLNEVTRRFGGATRSTAVGTYYLVYFFGGSLGGAVATAVLQLGLELPVFAGRQVPGFATAQLLLAVAPAIAVIVIVVSLRRQRRRLVQGRSACR